jgi:hypothetical protein
MLREDVVQFGRSGRHGEHSPMAELLVGNRLPTR